MRLTDKITFLLSLRNRAALRLILVIGAGATLPACLALPDETATPGTTVPVGEAPVEAACPEHPYESITLESPIPQTVADELIGLTEGAAATCANELGWGFRVVQRDGEDFPATMDYRADRVSVVVENGTVVSVTVG